MEKTISSRAKLRIKEFGRFNDYENEPNNNFSHEYPTPYVGEDIVWTA
nr:MAG TPA: hypothetical protein [Caudoviricetes sp.]